MSIETGDSRNLSAKMTREEAWEKVVSTRFNQREILAILDGAENPLRDIIEEILRIDRTEDVWQDLARCATADPESFFPEKGDTVRPVKKICQQCPVRTDCEEYALQTGQRHGVWGGLSERERRRILKVAS